MKKSMTSAERHQLETEFCNRVLAAVKICKEDLGYTPTVFETMITKWGILPTGKKLIRLGISYGITRLYELKRLDLSIESIMLEDKFNPLFTKDELLAAEWHLMHIKK